MARRIHGVFVQPRASMTPFAFGHTPCHAAEHVPTTLVFPCSTPMKRDDSMQRLALYVFYHKDGILAEHVLYYLQGLQTVASRVILIANGRLSDNAKARLDALAVSWIVRDNTGLDFAAWKCALERVGYEKLGDYDEIILCNCSCYGPIYPFTEVFSAMEPQPCDFWGLFRHPEVPETYPAHLQSYFLVLRRSLTTSQAFRTYWQTVKTARNWDEAVGQEVQFTRYFEEKGFSSRAYMTDPGVLSYLANLSVLLPQMLARKGRFPLLKRKAFTERYALFFAHGAGSQACEMLSILAAESRFPREAIYQDLAETMQAAGLRRIMHHTFVLPDTGEAGPEDGRERVALVVFSTIEALIEDCLRYLQSMPEDSDVYVVVVSERMKTLWKRRVAELGGRHVDIRVQPDRGREISACWLTCRDAVEDHDILCIAGDSNASRACTTTQEYAFLRHCWDSVLYSPNYVHNVLELFRRNPHMGVLLPVPPVFADSAAYVVGQETSKVRQCRRQLYHRLALHVPFDERPDIAHGGVFWARSKAMVSLYRHPWSFEDFPEEPLTRRDRTLFEALKGCYAMLAQEAGYVSGWITPVSMAGVHYDNLYFLLQQREAAQHDIAELHFKQVKGVVRAYARKVLSRWSRKLQRAGRLPYRLLRDRFHQLFL